MVIQTIETGSCTPQTIVIGRRGTYETMQIAFDLSYLIEAFGSGTAVLAVKRSQDESAYPAVVTQDGSTLTWTVSETDTAYVGSGECQLMWYVDGGLAKSIIYPMVVMKDILSTAEEPPDGYENWIESLTALGAETLQNAQASAESASDAEDAKDDAVAAKEAAETAQEAAEEAQEKAEIAVSHYPVIINGYWNIWSVEAQTYVSTGVKAEGDDGYSPEVTITTITGGHRVTITDEDHPQGQSFDVMDGQGGGSSDYTDLTNKPQINGHTLTGNQTAAQLGLATPSDIPTDAGDIEYDETETYASGSVGAELSAQKNAISQNEESIADTQSMIATVEATATASKNYAVGDLLVYDGKLYEVTSAIATGATITVGTNVTQTTVESQIASGGGGGGGEDNWCVIANMELTEAIGSSTASEVFLDLTTDIDGNLLADKKIRHLVVSVHYANSDDGLPNGPSIMLNGAGYVCGSFPLGKNQYTTAKIDVLNSNHVLFWRTGTAQSFNDSNVLMPGGFAVGGNILNSKDTIDRVRLRTNYPNGTIFPAGSTIMITGW